MIFLQLEIHYNTPSAHSNIKDFLPLISVVVTLVLFIVDRLIASRIRKKEIQRNWYLKVLVEPNLVRINDFFDLVCNTYSNASIFLLQSKNVAHEDYVILCVQENEKFIDLKRVLIAYLIYPLSNNYPAISEKIDKCLQDLEDDFTVGIDKERFSMDAINEFKLNAYKKKSELLNILYSPLSKKN
jgi:hypothetical protein